MLTENKKKLDSVIQLEVPDEVVIRRISGRYWHPVSGRIYNIYFKPPKVEGKDDVTGEPLVQRSDDKEEIIKTRLGQYHQYADHLLEHYGKQGLVRKINAQQSIETVYNQVKKFF